MWVRFRLFLGRARSSNWASARNAKLVYNMAMDGTARRWRRLVCACLLLSATPASALDVAVPYVHGDYLAGKGYSGIGLEVGVLDLFLADSSHSAISGNYRGSEIFINGGTWTSAHATEVTGAAVSQHGTYTGVAPGAGWWTGQTCKRSSTTTIRAQTTAAETFGQGLGKLSGDPVEVITLSIGLSGQTDGADQWSLALDHIVSTNGRTITVAAGNDGPGGGTLMGRPSGAYNAIIVGATGGTGGSSSEDYSNLASYSSRGPTTDGRCKPDIVAPGSVIHMPTLGGGWTDASGASYATPIVAGGAALLIDMGRQLGHSTDPKVIKSVLLNSAEKLAGWSNTSTRPLDYGQGAGQMDLRAAGRQYLFDERDPGTVAGVGWDLQQAVHDAENSYAMDVRLPAGAMLAATLTWDRIVTTNTEDIETVTYTFDHLDDLNLYLYSADDLVNPVAASVSTVDNVEHIYFSVTQPGEYVIGVEMAGADPGDWAEYGLAWRVFPAAGLDAPGDANLDAVVDVLDLAALANNYNGTDITWFEGDFNYDGVANVLDLAILANNYGSGSAAAAIPEPASALLLCLGACLALRRRRR